MLGGYRLAAHSTTGHGDDGIELGGGIGSHQRQLHQHPIHFIEKISFEWPVIDGDVTRSGPEEYACSGCFSATSSVVLN
jgi:hypothetical protein